MIEINIAGSKSISNRALILSVLSGTTITLENFGFCSDTELMIENLEKLGVTFQRNKTNLQVDPSNFNQDKSPIKLYTADAGTTTRFLTALCALLEREIEIDGSERMRERPIAPLIDALNQLGADITCPSNCPPVKIKPARLQSGKASIPGNISSQYISAIMMIAPFLNGPTKVKITGDLHSRPYLKITENLLEPFGQKITWETENSFNTIPNPQISAPKKLSIEPDASSASYIGAYIAAHPKKEVRIKNLNKNSIQGDIKFFDYLKAMGCKVERKGSDSIITSAEKLKPLGHKDFNETPDLVMTFAVLALLTEGETLITNVANLRIKETDRLKALENELKKFQVQVKTGEDYIKISGQAQKPTEEIKTYNDHRMAMSFGVIQDLFDLKIENPDCVKKSYSNFWEDLNKLQNAA